MSTVLDALRKAEQGGVRGGGYLGAPPPEPPRRGRRFLWILLGIVALVAAFAGGLELSGDSNRSDEPVAANDEPAREEKNVVHDVEAKPGEPPVEVARVEPVEKARDEARVATAPPEAVPAPVPTLETLTTAEKNERREQVMRRILERRGERSATRQERAARREERQVLRDSTKDLKEAIRSAPSPQDRDALRAEFNKQRQESRRQRRASMAEKRAERAEAALATVSGRAGEPAPGAAAGAPAGPSAPPGAPASAASVPPAAPPSAPSAIARAPAPERAPPPPSTKGGPPPQAAGAPPPRAPAERPPSAPPPPPSTAPVELALRGTAQAPGAIAPPPPPASAPLASIGIRAQQGAPRGAGAAAALAAARGAPPPPSPPAVPPTASQAAAPPPPPRDGGQAPVAERFEAGGGPPTTLARADVPGGAAPGSGSGGANPLRRAPSGAPQVRINILQYSPDPARRFAYVSVEGAGAMTQVREGESYEGLTVRRILPEMVEFANSTSTFMLRAN